MSPPRSPRFSPPQEGRPLFGREGNTVHGPYPKAASARRTPPFPFFLALVVVFFLPQQEVRFSFPSPFSPHFPFSGRSCGFFLGTEGIFFFLSGFFENLFKGLSCLRDSALPPLLTERGLFPFASDVRRFCRGHHFFLLCSLFPCVRHVRPSFVCGALSSRRPRRILSAIFFFFYQPRPLERSFLAQVFFLRSFLTTSPPQNAVLSFLLLVHSSVTESPFSSKGGFFSFSPEAFAGEHFPPEQELSRV